MKDIIEKIDKVKGDYEAEDQKWLEELKRALEEAEATVQFKNHFVVQKFLESCRQVIAACDERLKNDRNMADRDRMVMFVKKDVYGGLLAIFDGSEEKIKAITEEVNTL